MKRLLIIILGAVTVACSPAKLSSEQLTALDATLSEMTAAAVTAESVTDSYSAVWSAAIQAGQDFNEKLLEHRVSAETKTQIDKLAQQVNSVEAKIKTLHTGGIPEPLFHQLGDAFELLARFQMQAISPSGTLQSFNTNTAELKSRLGGSISRVRLYLPLPAPVNAK